MIANFLFFWALLTFAIGRGDPVGMLVALAGFLVMHVLIEDRNGQH